MDELIPMGCGPGKLYGMCKVHKKDNPMRPVVSMIGTPEYQLSKYLDSLIKPNMPDKFMLYSTDNFLKKLNEFEIRPNDYCVSFDVTSLFTNVPLKQTIQIIADHIYSNEAKLTPTFSKECFIKLLMIATGGMFIYRDEIFRQTDGVAMGNPLAPTLANFFLGYLEKSQIFNTTSDFYPAFYVRYVDDIFCIFRSNVESSEFLNLLNSLHANISFTFEKSNGSLPFLDVNIELKDDGCDTWVFRKETHTSVFLNFWAVAPVKWKSGLISGMLHRAKRICSTPKLFNTEVAKLKSMFLRNSYSARFFDKRLENFLNSTNTPTPIAEDNQNFKYNLHVPFIGKPSYAFSKQVSALLGAQFDIDVNVVYNTLKVGSFFSLKSRTPKSLISRVVYKFTCLGDPGIAYIGVCNRFVIERVREHVAYWRKSPTAVGKHIAKCQTCQQTELSLDHFNVLKVCREKFDAKIFEALFIKRLNPRINRQMFANKGAGFTLRIFD